MSKNRGKYKSENKWAIRNIKIWGAGEKMDEKDNTKYK